MNVVKLRESSLADIPSQLRELAQKIQDGEHGVVSKAVVVLETHLNVKTFGYGVGCDAPNAVFLMQASVAKLVVHE